MLQFKIVLNPYKVRCYNLNTVLNPYNVRYYSLNTVLCPYKVRCRSLNTVIDPYKDFSLISMSPSSLLPVLFLSLFLLPPFLNHLLFLLPVSSSCSATFSSIPILGHLVSSSAIFSSSPIPLLSYTYLPPPFLSSATPVFIPSTASYLWPPSLPPSSPPQPPARPQR